MLDERAFVLSNTNRPILKANSLLQTLVPYVALEQPAQMIAKKAAFLTKHAITGSTVFAWVLSLTRLSKRVLYRGRLVTHVSN